MSSLRDPLTFSCTNCEAAIHGSVTFFVGLPFCCAGCVAGGPCTCSYDPEPMFVHRTSGPVSEHAATSVEAAAVPAPRGLEAATEDEVAVTVSARQDGQLVHSG
jgi:hypothetical protein